jgi:hypothetical protein
VGIFRNAVHHFRKLQNYKVHNRETGTLAVKLNFTFVADRVEKGAQLLNIRTGKLYFIFAADKSLEMGTATEHMDCKIKLHFRC